MNINNFVLRNRKETFKKAIRVMETEMKSFPAKAQKVHDLLIEWAGKYLWRHGYKPTKIDFISNEGDYSAMVGIGAVIEGEKFNDARGWMLFCMESMAELKDDNKRLRNEYDTLKHEILETSRETYYKIFPGESKDIEMPYCSYCSHYGCDDCENGSKFESGD